MSCRRSHDGSAGATGLQPPADRAVPREPGHGRRADGGPMEGRWRADGGPMEGRPLLLLTTIGAKTGQRRTSPMMYIRSPELTVASRRRERVWFLLHRGWFHQGRKDLARAVLSTGVLTLRRTAGECARMDRQGEAIGLRRAWFSLVTRARAATRHVDSLPGHHRKRKSFGIGIGPLSREERGERWATKATS